MDLTKPERMLLEAIRCALREEKTAWEKVAPEDWTKLMTLAGEQKLLPLVVDAVYACPAAGAWPEFAACRKQARLQTVAQAQRAQEFLRVYGGLAERLPVPPLVVKGSVCRAIYPKGDLRQSADEDLLVRPEDFALACRELEGWGLAHAPRANLETDDEVGWRSGDSPLYLELHRSLFDTESSVFGDLNALFSGAFDRAVVYPVEQGGGQVASLRPQDHLLYLLLHAFKHFIHSGVGLRQICDIGLWAKRYADALAWDKLRADLAGVRALKFAKAVFAIAKEDLGIDPGLPEDWEDPEIDRGPLLRELLQAGIYGSSTMSRRHSARITRDAVAAERGGRGSSGPLSAVFPSGKSLERDYPELKDHPGRLPLVWGKRLVKYCRASRRAGDDRAADSLRIGRERVALLREYGILSE